MMPIWSNDKYDENLSDWTLTINGEKQYFVHRLALHPPRGPRVCEYFRPLFYSPKLWNESQSSSSSVELPPGAAAVMDRFLDYVYTGKTDVDMNNVVPLRFVARYFGCWSFFESVSFRNSISVPTKIEDIVEYYHVAKEYQDDIYLEVLPRQLTKCLSRRKVDFPNKYDDGDYAGLFRLDFVQDLLPNLKPPKDDCEGETILFFASIRRILIDFISDPIDVSRFVVVSTAFSSMLLYTLS